MTKTVPFLLAFSVLFITPQWAHAEELVAALEGTDADPTQEATIEVQQQKEREEDGTGFQIHGVGYLSYMAPFDQPSLMNQFLGQLETQWTDGTVGVYSTFRAKINDFKSPVDKGYLYFQQAYGFYRHAYGDVKVGKVYSRFGRLWDYGYYGPLLSNDDIKLQPDLGISAEGSPELADNFNLEYALQYFAADGHSISISNRELFSFAEAHRRNIVVVRLAPTLHFDHDTWVALGVSGQRFDSALLGDHQVLRGALDIDVAYGPVSGFAEIGQQRGGDIALSHNTYIAGEKYFWAGASLNLDPVNLRYHFNAIYYGDDNSTVDYLHQPGIEVALNEHASLMGELVLWTSSNPAKPVREKSFYVIGVGKF